MATARWDLADIALVSKAITEQSLCVPCIIAQTGVTRARVDMILGALGEAVVIERELAPCPACERRQRVFRLRTA